MVVLLLSLLLYQDHYSEAVVENFYEKKVLSESESRRNTCEQAARKELPTIAGQIIFQNTPQNRPTTICIVIVINVINVIILY